VERFLRLPWLLWLGAGTVRQQEAVKRAMHGGGRAGGSGRDRGPTRQLFRSGNHAKGYGYAAADLRGHETDPVFHGNTCSRNYPEIRRNTRAGIWARARTDGGQAVVTVQVVRQIDSDTAYDFHAGEGEKARLGDFTGVVRHAPKGAER
jgi:hypothetical protein